MSLEVLLSILRRSAALLFGALLASACRDPAPSTGTLVVSVTGLPTGAIAGVRVTGPNQFIRLVRVSATLENLVPGAYIITRDTVLIANARYGVVKGVDTITITRGRTESAAAAYQLASGALTVTVDGLPSGTLPILRVLGPLPSTQVNSQVSPGMTLNALRPGQYEVRGEGATSFAGDNFVASPATQTVTVTASLTPAQSTVSYVLVSGALALTVNGMPAGVSGQAITVSGPGGYEVRTGQSVTLRGLSPGTYSVSAINVTGPCPDFYTTSNAPQSFDVAIGQTSDATVTYSQGAVSSANLNLSIENVYLTQATQNPDGTVPLLSGKTAFVRVFGVANQCNSAKPRVRVTLSTGPVLTIDAPEDSVRVRTDEGLLFTTWNAVIPGSAIQPGMTVVVEMDVTNASAETDEGDNRFPPSGSQNIDVVAAPVVGLRLVPITQTQNNLTGSVNQANVATFLDWPLKIHPVGAYDVEIGETFTTQTALRACTSISTGLDSLGRCPSWVGVLNELRTAQAGQTLRYVYGVARVTYNSGVAGIAYVPGKTGMVWDHIDSQNSGNNSGSRVMAHELGHNFNRQHSPCGGPAFPDQSYPYSGGKIGAFGWDPIEGLKAASVFTDVMGYCNNQWISDYTYVGMLDWLISHPTSLPSTASSVQQPSLLVWGRIENGVPVLEPTFEISARPEPPALGPHRLTASDATGAPLFSIAFAGERIADLPGEHESFAFTVPLSALRGRALASLSLTARGRTVTSVASADVASDPGVVTTQAGPRAMRIRWDATRFPVVMVRNPVSGQVLSFARGGDITIATARTALELNFSNRVRSSRRLTQLK